MSSNTTWFSFPANTPITEESEQGKRRKRPPEPVEWSIGVKDAATMLGLHPQSIYAYARAGRIPAVRYGNRWRFNPEKLREWAAKQKGAA